MHFPSTIISIKIIADINGRPCSCGQNGCVEAYSSAKSLCRRVIELDKIRNEKSPSNIAGIKLSSKSNSSTEDSMDAKEIFSRLANGDENALRAVDEVCMSFGK